MGIRLESILCSTACFIFITSSLAWFRRNRLPENERFGIEFQLTKLGRDGGTWDKVLSVILALAILVALGALGYVIAAPRVEERFTEFYILRLEGKATAYPKELNVGEEEKVMVGIVNHEHETVSYRVEVRVDGVKNNEIGPIVLEHDEKREEVVSFTMNEPGEDQKVEFLLYKDGEAEPYLEPLRLWVDVTE